MRFGLALPHYGFSFPDGVVSFSRVADAARRAEALGFDSVWMTDHFFYSFERYGADPSPIASLEPLTALAGVAALTDRVRLGTLVLSAPFRHPAQLAKCAATIDALSGGRLELGVGAGWFEGEFRAFGYGFGTAGARFDALGRTLAVLDALRREGPVDLDADGIVLRGASLNPPLTAPLWVGGKGGPRLLRLAARHGAGWNTVWRISPEAYASKVADVERACEAEGRDRLPLSVGLYSLVAEDERSVAALWERGRARMPGGALDGGSWDDFRADTLSGTPEQAIERVKSFDALGVEELIVSPWVLPCTLHEPEILDVLAERVFPSCR